MGGFFDVVSIPDLLGHGLGRYPSVQRNRIRYSLGITDEALVIGAIAYFRTEKPYDVLFAAIDEIRNKIPKWSLLILGDGPLECKFKHLCKEKGLERNVRFLGSVLDVEQYVPAMDIICFVPRSNEGCSNAVLERMAMTKPIIVTDIGANAELIEDGESGIIIPPNDVPRLSDAILTLFNDPGQRRRMGENAKERVRKYFLLEHTIAQMDRVYREMRLEAKQ